MGKMQSYTVKSGNSKSQTKSKTKGLTKKPILIADKFDLINSRV
jgi:hypothetical protein